MTTNNKGYICCECRKPISFKNEYCICCGEANLYVSIREVIIRTSLSNIETIKISVEEFLEQKSIKYNGLGGIINQSNVNYLKWWLVNKVEIENHKELKNTIAEILDLWVC